MAVYAERVGRLLAFGVRCLPVRGRAMALEAVLILQSLMHADHFRVLAVAYRAGGCGGAGCAKKENYRRGRTKSSFHVLIIPLGENFVHDLDQ